MTLTRTHWIVITASLCGVLLVGAFVFWLRLRATEGLLDTPGTIQTAPRTTSGTQTSVSNLKEQPGLPGIPQPASSTAPRPATNPARFQERPTEENPIVPTPEPSVSGSGSLDADLDGLTADQELQLGTDPNNVDTDRDGLTDGDEVNKYKSSPKNADTDNDGYNDGQEVRSGYNPLGPGKCAATNCVP